MTRQYMYLLYKESKFSEEEKSPPQTVGALIQANLYSSAPLTWIISRDTEVIIQRSQVRLPATPVGGSVECCL